MSRDYNITGPSTKESEKRKKPENISASRRAWCPSCFGGIIYYSEKQGTFYCDKCGIDVIITTKDGKNLKITTK